MPDTYTPEHQDKRGDTIPANARITYQDRAYVVVWLETGPLVRVEFLRRLEPVIRTVRAGPTRTAVLNFAHARRIAFHQDTAQ